ncbi:hypothetical protein ACFYKX_14100 [Cytobacillus sp. FJAT-54145]|uniref:Uncharacterized protein n=1 Tax=Cytobacillus spartinae TaxID=3299023 RepID=A0ABW6KFS0_9BACI
MINTENSRLDRVEDILTQLIKAVGETNEAVQEMKAENEKRHQEFIEFKDLSEKRHIEVMDRFDDIELDQDVIWNKSVENERKFRR